MTDWDAVLDDLEARVAAAEAGDLTRLEGWTPPAVRPPAGTDPARAVAIATRQRALLAQLRQQRALAATKLGAMRRQQRLGRATAAPVYVDRLG